MDLSKLNALKDKTQDTEINKPAQSPTISTSTPAVAGSEEKTFQVYRSSRISMRMITSEGIPILFSNYEYITDNYKVIEYLDNEIALGLKEISKGEAMSSREADPMERLRQKHIEEYLAKKEEEKINEALGKEKNMGSYREDGKPGDSIKPTTSKQVAN